MSEMGTDQSPQQRNDSVWESHPEQDQRGFRLKDHIRNLEWNCFINWRWKLLMSCVEAYQRWQESCSRSKTNVLVSQRWHLLKWDESSRCIFPSANWGRPNDRPTDQSHFYKVRTNMERGWPCQIWICHRPNALLLTKRVSLYSLQTAVNTR